MTGSDAALEPERLEGGNATAEVVRIGDTVRKAWTSSTPSVRVLMDRVRESGVDLALHRGRDAEGRQVVEFVPGRLALGHPLDLAGLDRVGALIRRIHDASPRPDELPDAHWDVLLPVEGADLICHNDLAPWNLIVGARWVFIDWDGAGPSTRLWDLAYSAQAFAIPEPGMPTSISAGRLRAFADGYRADSDLRAALPDAMVRRTTAMHAHLVEARSSGWEPWASMYDDGHGAFWGRMADEIRAGHDAWAEALR